MRLKFFLLVGTLLLVGCSYERLKTKTTNAPAAGQFKIVGFDLVLRNIIAPGRCLQCHDGTMGDYNALTQQGRVVPGSPEQSRLYTKVASGAMPQGGPSLPAASVELLRRWIADGAHRTSERHDGRDVTEELPVDETEPTVDEAESSGDLDEPLDTEIKVVGFNLVLKNIIEPGKCVNCHGGGMSDRHVLIQRGQVVAGAPEQSPFYTVVASGSMPKGGPALPAESVELLRRWIADGAQVETKFGNDTEETVHSIEEFNLGGGI